MYPCNDLLQTLIGNCTTVHLFEDNPAFDGELIFLLPSILKAIKKIDL